MTDLPSGVVTFLLTDVVGSTELWERCPQAMDRALARHDEIVTETVDAEGGTVLKARGEGDSAFCVFARATDAIRAAHRLQSAMGAETWPAETPLTVRAALHSGEAVERDRDFYGPAVNRAARLRSIAPAGGVIVGSTTAALVVDGLPAGCAIVEVGRVRLRGFGVAETVYALSGPGLAPAPGPDPTPSEGRDHARPSVSPREGEVLELVCGRLTNGEIASRLYISERTVESHVSSLLRKFGVGDRRELIGAAQRSPHTSPTPTPVLLPAALELLADPTTYVGRTSEQASLNTAWQRARSGHVIAVVVSGEAGMGKSRLVAELAATVHAEGNRVLLGACFEDVDRPYGPFVDLIAAEAADLGSEAARRRAGDDVDALACLSTDLARTFGVTDPVRGGPVDREVVLDAIVRWLIASATDHPLLVVVEDLHWSTSTSRDALRHLLRRGARQPLLIVATTRDNAPDLDDNLRTVLAELERLPAVERIAVDALNPDEVGRLGDLDASEAEQICALTGGNPLLVTHVTAGATDGSLHALLARRDEHLDAAQRELLDLAATFGAEFDADLLVAGGGGDLLPVLDSLEVAERAGWIAAQPGRPGRFAFVHALFRSYRYEILPLRRRLELHARAATAIGGREDPRLLADEARHACLAVPLVDAREAIDLACRAGEQAERADAYDEAAVHYQRARDVLGALDPPDAHTNLDISIRLGAALHHSGVGEGLTLLLDAATEAQRIGDEEALIHAAVSIPQFGAILNPLGVDRRFSSITEAALAVLDRAPSPTRALLTADLACHLLFANRIPEAVAAAGEAEAMARAMDDPHLLGQVLLAARHVAATPSRAAESERVARELVELGRGLHRLPFTLAGLSSLAGHCFEHRDLEGCRAGDAEFDTLLGDRPLAFFQLERLVHHTWVALLDGELAHAERLAFEMAPLARSIGHSPAAWTGSTLVALRRLQAHDDELRPGLDRILQDNDGLAGGQRCIRIAVQARTGATQQAAEGLIALREDGFPIPRAYPWALSYSELAEAADVVGDEAAARHVFDEVAPFAGWIGNSGPVLVRLYDEVLAQAALTFDPVMALSHAERAVEQSREIHSPVFLARGLIFLAEAKHRTGAPSSEFRPLAAEAESLADRIGLSVVHEDLRRFGLSD